jgi:hypothetical protein
MHSYNLVYVFPIDVVVFQGTCHYKSIANTEIQCRFVGLLSEFETQ